MEFTSQTFYILGSAHLNLMRMLLVLTLVHFSCEDTERFLKLEFYGKKVWERVTLQDCDFVIQREKNKPDWATMRLDCVFKCMDYVTCLYW